MTNKTNTMMAECAFSLGLLWSESKCQQIHKKSILILYTAVLLLRSLGVHHSLLTICNTCNIGISCGSRGGVGGTCLPNGACFLWLESSPWESHMIGWCHHVGYAAENNVPSLLERSVFLYTIVTGHRIQGHKSRGQHCRKINKEAIFFKISGFRVFFVFFSFFAESVSWDHGEATPCFR